MTDKEHAARFAQEEEQTFEPFKGWSLEQIDRATQTNTPKRAAELRKAGNFMQLAEDRIRREHGLPARIEH